MRLWFVVLVIASLAGCTDGTVEPAVQVLSDEDALVLDVEAAGAGAIAGLVVDESYTPLAGVTVRVPGLERDTISDESGAFGLGNLPPGPIFVRAEGPGLLPAGVETLVTAGDITEVTIVLEPDTTEPYVQVTAFKGFTDYTYPPYLTVGSLACTHCDFRFNPELGADALVVEVYSGRGDTDPTGLLDRPRLQIDISTLTTNGVVREFTDDPARLEFGPGHELVTEPTLTIGAYPYDVVPQVNVEFDVVVATFHDGAQMSSWSYVEGRT